MQTITDYKIIAASLDNTMESFGETIDALIEEGWQPHGQPFIAFDNRQHTHQAKIGQAMVKYGEKPDGLREDFIEWLMKMEK